MKWFRQLRERRGREATGAFLVEGPRAIIQALSSGALPARVAYSPELAEGSARALEALSAIPPTVPVLSMDSKALRSIGDTVNSQGVIAAFPTPVRQSLHFVPTSLVLVLDRVSDPGNVGTVLRSAAVAGCDGVLLSTGCADPYNPKAVRASAGGIFNVKLELLTWPEITGALHSLSARYAADGRGETVYYEADLSSGCAILIGNEATGLGQEALTLSTASIRIPLGSGMESLNAGVAASVLLFEARRQRMQSTARSDP